MEYLTTPDFKEDIWGCLEVPPYRQTDFTPQGFPASHRTSEIYQKYIKPTVDSISRDLKIKSMIHRYVHKEKERQYNNKIGTISKSSQT